MKTLESEVMKLPKLPFYPDSTSVAKILGPGQSQRFPPQWLILALPVRPGVAKTLVFATPGRTLVFGFLSLA